MKKYFKARFTILVLQIWILSVRIFSDLIFAKESGYICLGVTDNGKIIGERSTNKLKAEINDLARKCEPSINIKKFL